MQIAKYGADFMPNLAFVIGAYDDISLRLHVQNASNEYISFYTIVANYNGPSAADIACIDDATHTLVTNCVIYHPGGYDGG